MDARVKPAHNALNKPAKLVFFARAFGDVDQAHRHPLSPCSFGLSHYRLT